MDSMSFTQQLEMIRNELLAAGAHDPVRTYLVLMTLLNIMIERGKEVEA